MFTQRGSKAVKSLKMLNSHIAQISHDETIACCLQPKQINARRFCLI